MVSQLLILWNAVHEDIYICCLETFLYKQSYYEVLTLHEFPVFLAEDHVVDSILSFQKKINYALGIVIWPVCLIVSWYCGLNMCLMHSIYLKQNINSIRKIEISTLHLNLLLIYLVTSNWNGDWISSHFYIFKSSNPQILFISQMHFIHSNKSQ